jgi:deoxyribose-phosphate aldolase
LKTGAGGLDEKAMSKLRVLFRKLLMRILNWLWFVPNMVLLASQMVSDAGSNLQIGTVIDFPEGGQLLMIN